MTTSVLPDSAIDPANENNIEEALAQAKKEVELLKATNPLNVVELALEAAIERTRTLEALKARDATVQRLVEAQESIRQKSAAIDLLQQNIRSRANSPFATDATLVIDRAAVKEEMARLERTIVEQRIEIRTLKDAATKSSEPSRVSFRLPEPTVLSQQPASQSDANEPSAELFSDKGLLPSQIPASDEPADMHNARCAILAELPIPKDVPEDTLSPVTIPGSLTLQEFIATLSGPTTKWCPECEEHGYFYTPTFKCSTNPRVSTAHRWSAVDVIGRMNKPTECFYHKDGRWYYAGIYTAFRLADLTTKEWDALPTEVVSLLDKETLVGRKNTTPQNTYEVNQLYAAGALKIACVALQCVGFNVEMYQAMLGQADAVMQSKWASMTTTAASAAEKASPAPTILSGLGSGALWNINANMNANANLNLGTLGGVAVPIAGDVVSGVARMNLGRRSQNENSDENTPAPIGEGRKRGA
ncbi:hypothetical protein H0H92_005732 [Tricholoma furcatifolium]|nr:hypothetical protein H0H92_005732 [Tricholoma furcatifolium]